MGSMCEAIFRFASRPRRNVTPRSVAPSVFLRGKTKAIGLFLKKAVLVSLNFFYLFWVYLVNGVI